MEIRLTQPSRAWAELGKNKNWGQAFTDREQRPPSTQSEMFPSLWSMILQPGLFINPSTMNAYFQTKAGKVTTSYIFGTH